MTPGMARILFQLRVDERHALVEVAIAEQRRHERQQLFAADAEIELPQMLKRLQQQAAARQQHDGERRFDDDERMLEPVAAAAGAAAAAVAQSFLQGEPRAAESRRKSERQSGGDGDRRGKRQHAPVERQPHGGHGLGHQRLQKPHDRNRERESGDGAESGEHQALDQKLRDQPAASCAERRAHRHFAAAHGSARHQQIRQVDARDQQDRRRRAEQHDQRRVRLARQLFPQRASPLPNAVAADVPPSRAGSTPPSLPGPARASRRA